MSKRPTIKVSALASGTVIDHLHAGTARRAFGALALPDGLTVTVGMNLMSSRMGEKDIIKIEGHELTADDAAKVALLSPEATLSIIRDFKVVEKIKLEPPERFRGLLRCPNPACIIHRERTPGSFRVVGTDPVTVVCEYCERDIPESAFDFV